MHKVTILILLLLSTALLAENKKEEKQYRYTIVEREHTKSEIWTHIGVIYALSWAVYPLTQWETVTQKGSWRKWKDNFGELTFDKDEPAWNWMVHPLSGSQLYLFYRANGYTKVQSLGLATVSSTLFEFTVETYTEPASVQDLYQTPVFGTIFGYGIEKASMWLLNTGTTIGKILGHTINPSTLFWFYKGKIEIIPVITKDKQQLSLYMDF